MEVWMIMRHVDTNPDCAFVVDMIQPVIGQVIIGCQPNGLEAIAPIDRNVAIPEPIPQDGSQSASRGEVIEQHLIQICVLVILRAETFHPIVHNATDLLSQQEPSAT
jgi:hypothetical protein